MDNNNEDTQLPYTVEGLIELLEQTYPNKSPSISDSDRQIWYKAGQSSVVNWLKELLNRSQN